MNWLPVTSDSFNRTNASSLGNSWIDPNSRGSIANGLAVILAGDYNGAAWVSRPASETNSTVQQVAITIPAGAAAVSGQAQYVVLRGQGSDTGADTLTGYVVGLNPATNNVQGYAIVGGSITATVFAGTGSQAIAGNYQPGHAYTLVASTTGTSPTTLTFALTDNTTGVVVASGTTTDSTAGIQAAGFTGIFQSGGVGASSMSISNFTNYIAATKNAASNLPYVVTSGSSQNEVLLTGTGTAWSGATTFSVSGSSSASIVSSANVSATQQVLKIVPGIASGLITIVGSDNSAAPLPVYVGTTIQPNDPKLIIKGPTSIGTQEAVSITSGPAGYLLYSGVARLRFNVAAVSVPPDIITQVDRDSPVRTSLQGASSPTIVISPTYTAATAVRANQHNLRWWNSCFEGTGSPQSNIDTWNSQLNAARLAGVDIIGGAGITPATASTRSFASVGDSLVQSIRTLYVGSASDQTIELPISDWSQQVADKLGYDLLQLGYGGTGVAVTGSGNVPPTQSSLGYNFNGSSWNVSAPSFVVLYVGTNDAGRGTSNSAFQAGYVNVLSRVRSLWPQVPIFAINPHCCNGSNESSQLANITAAVSTFGSTGIVVADASAAGLNTSNTSGDYADNVGHLNPGGHNLLANWIANLIQTNPIASFPQPGQVLSGVNFNTSSVGTLVVPQPAQVQAGVAFGANNGTTGTLSIPSASKVISPTAFGANGGTTGTAIMPLASQVSQGVAMGPDANGATSGILTLPSPQQTQAGIVYGIGGNGSVGTLVIPPASSVVAPTAFGPSSGLTGTALAATGNGPNPTSLVLTVDGTNPLVANCWVTTDQAGANPITGVNQSNASGGVMFNLTTGTQYFLWAEANGYRAAALPFMA